ncbi:hypothetical protein CXG81DRAFT_14999, partial [Caulochytrium protostelioides]
MDPKPLRTIDGWELTKTLGQGSMGKVKLAVHTQTQQQLACKIILRPTGPFLFETPYVIKDTRDLRGLADDVFPENQPGYADAFATAEMRANSDISKEMRVLREALLMLLMDHPNICRMHMIVFYGRYIYLFLDLIAGGQMLDYIISHGKLKERQARKFMRQIVSAVDYCHRNAIVHRDLKIENILIGSGGEIQIIDFGLANLYSSDRLLKTFCGSLYFAAPELLCSKKYTGSEVDVWSIGIILYVLVCGRVPFDDSSIYRLHEKIKRGILEFPTHLSADVKALLTGILNVNSEKRWTLSEIKHHPWLNKGYSGPPDNFYVPRPPQLRHVDPHIVACMRGLDLGSSEAITRKVQRLV